MILQRYDKRITFIKKKQKKNMGSADISLIIHLELIHLELIHLEMILFGLDCPQTHPENN